MADITVPIASNFTSTTPLNLGSYIASIVGVALSVAALAAFAFLVLGGINWITAGGDKGKIEEARSRITNAIIGLAIVAASWAIFLLIDNFFGIGITSSSSSSSSYANSGSGSGSGSNTTNEISFICTTITQCDAYCPSSDYYTVKNTTFCGNSNIGCACLHKQSSKASTICETYECKG